MTLEEQKRVLIEYLSSRIEARDWHAVRDAAVDIEILDIQIQHERKPMNAEEIRNTPNLTERQLLRELTALVAELNDHVSRLVAELNDHEEAKS